MTDGSPLCTVTNAHPERRYSISDLEPYMLEPPAPAVPPRAPRSTPLEQRPTGDRPGDIFARDIDSAHLLEQRGWQLHHTDARSGDRHYTRPGKNTRDGSSAVVHPDGTCWVFTDATELPPNRWMDSFGLYTLLNHGGDFIASTAAVRAMGYGRPPSPGPNTSTARAAASADDSSDPERRGLAAFFIDWPAMWTTDTPDEDWLIRPFIARGRGHALYAGAKTGKSWLMLEVAAAAATGRSILHEAPRDPIHVLYIDYEMTLSDVRDRLETFGYDDTVDLSHLHYALLPSIPRLDTYEGGNEVLYAAQEVGAELVVIDTTARAVTGEENDANVYKAFYDWTGKPLKAAGIAWARLDHAGKDVTKGQRGSSAKNDDVDVVWRLERREGNALRVTATHKRMPWVPDSFDLTSTETDHGTQLMTDTPTYPTGTLNVVVPFLDEHDAPLNIGRNKARQMLKQAGVAASTDAIRAALNYRKNRAETLAIRSGQQSGQVTGDTPQVEGQGHPVNPTSASQVSPQVNQVRPSGVRGPDDVTPEGGHVWHHADPDTPETGDEAPEGWF